MTAPRAAELILVKGIRLPAAERCGHPGCASQVVYKLELPHRLRIFCREHGLEYLGLASQILGMHFQFDTRERPR